VLGAAEQENADDTETLLVLVSLKPAISSTKTSTLGLPHLTDTVRREDLQI